jgi:hypothetical protein
MSLRAGSAEGGNRLGVNPTLAVVKGLGTVRETAVQSAEPAFVVTEAESTACMALDDGVAEEVPGVLRPTPAGDDLGEDALWLLLHLPLLEPGVLLLLLLDDIGVRTRLPEDAEPPLSSGEPVLSLVHDS